VAIRLTSGIVVMAVAIRAWLVRMRIRARRARRARPETRGQRLLRTWLSVEQRSQFDQKQYFEVTGCDTGKRYRVHHGLATNVHELDATGAPSVGWCFAPEGYLVAADVMLAQKIALETSECATLAAANRLPIRR